MTFLYPLGLLGLIGIPILIIIYIIKNKYMEQTIASTYIWTLSERFLKRKRPISKLAGIISLILQILAVTFISFAVAHPIIRLPGQANAYCFVLDASGSMCMQSGKSTRFEKGKEQIEEIIATANDGSEYTFVCVSDTANKSETFTDKKLALAELSGLNPAYVDMDVEGALKTAQGMFDENASTIVYFITDRNCESAQNVNVINVAGEEKNYSVLSLSATPTEDAEGKITGYVVSGEVGAYGVSDIATLDLYVDGAVEPVQTAEVEIENGKGTFSFTKQGGYTVLRVVIRQKDDLIRDNEYVLYNIEEVNQYHALIVSKNPFFLQSAVTMMNGESNTTVLKPEEYNGQTGYDLYVFDGVAPAVMPVDGVVWFFGIKENVPNSGFSVQGEMNFYPEPHGKLQLTDSTESTVQEFIKDLTQKEDVVITKYVKYGLYRNFTAIYEYKGMPMVFTGMNTSGYREVVFSFDVHDSNLPLLFDFPVLMRNLWNFSFPAVVESTVCVGGEEVKINALPNCNNIRVDSPTGKISYLEMEGGASIFTPDEVGVYTITLTGNDLEKEYYIYSALPDSERNVSQGAGTFDVIGERDDGGLDGVKDVLLIAFICLALLFVVDWMVYCYDKYQLR